MRGFLVLFILLFASIYSVVYYNEIKALEKQLPDEIFNAFHRLYLPHPIHMPEIGFARDPTIYPEWWSPAKDIYDFVLHIGFEIIVIYVGIIVWIGCDIVVFVGETLKSILP